MTVRRNIMSNKKIITLLMGLLFFNPYVFSSDNTNTENNQRSQKESRKKEIQKKYQHHTPNMMSKALYNAVNHSVHDIVIELIEAGANVNVNIKDHSVLMLASQQCKPEIAKTLLKAGANLEQTNSGVDGSLGETPLCLTVMKDCSSVAKILIAHGANINTVSCEGYNKNWEEMKFTPLGYAFYNYPESKKVIEVLIRAGAVD